MYALVGDEAKVNLAFSVDVFGVLTQEAAGQDGGDFGGACGGGELVGWRQYGGRHVVSSGCGTELGTIVMAELTLDHPGISSV